MGSMHTLTRTGDIKLEWDPNNEEEVAVARDMFEERMRDRFAAYRTQGDNWRQGEQIRAFDPEAERIIFLPAQVGG